METEKAQWQAPYGYEEILSLYGDIHTYISDEGALKGSWFRERASFLKCPWDLRLSWGAKELPDGTIVEVPVKRFSYHVAITSFPKVIKAIYEEGLGRYLKYYGGGFNFRSQRGSADRISLHAFIAAWDFNPATNKMGRKGRMHPRVVEVFEDHGFIWGGRFSRPDPMHFQAAVGY